MSWISLRRRTAVSSRFASIQLRIFLAFGTFIVLILAGGGWALTRSFNESQRREIESRQATLVTLLTRSMDDRISTYLESLSAAAAHRISEGTAPKTFAAWLEEQPGLRALFPGGLFLLTRDGRIVASSTPNGVSPGTLAPLKPFIQSVADRQRPEVSEAFTPSAGAGVSVMMAAPLRGRLGLAPLVLGGVIDLAHDHFLGTLAEEPLPSGGYLVLQDAKGRALLHPGKAVSEGPYLTLPRRLDRMPWTLTAHTPLLQAHTPLDRLRHTLQAASATAVLLALILTWLLSHRLTQNLEAFTRQVEGAADQPAGHRAIVGTSHDETQVLVEAFNGLMAKLDQKTGELLQAKAEGDEELALAKHVLHRMLEPGLAALPSHLHMETLQTRRINGDACTYRQGLGGLHFGLMCDATGHGLTAGISTMPAIQAFLSMVARDIPLETVYREINRRIHQLMPVDRFLCLMLLRLDLRNGTLSVLNAGLPDAILQVPGTPRRRFPSRNLPAGILVTAEAPVVETAEVIPGSRLLAFTDGVLDLFPMAEAERRLMDGLDSCPLDVHRDSIKETLALAIENQEQHDDVSWALWEVPASCEAPCLAQPNPEPPSPLELDEPLTLTLAFAPQRHDIRDLVPNLVRLLAAHGLESPHDQVLALLLSEALSNAVDHGLLGLDPALRHHGAEVYRALRNLHLHAHQDGEIRLSLQFRTLPSGPIREIIVEIEDPGPGFDWRTWMQTSGRTPSAAASRGLRLIQALSRELSFNDAGNRIRFVLSCS